MTFWNRLCYYGTPPNGSLHQPDFTKHNVTLVAISPRQPDDSLSTEEKNELQ